MKLLENITMTVLLEHVTVLLEYLALLLKAISLKVAGFSPPPILSILSIIKNWSILKLSVQPSQLFTYMAS